MDLHSDLMYDKSMRIDRSLPEETVSSSKAYLSIVFLLENIT